MARGGRPYSLAERQAIIAGTFFTPAELRAHPGLGQSVLRDAAKTAVTGRVDPNTRPVSAQARRDAETNGVCAWCWEPGDDRSALVLQADHSYRHPECQADKDAGR